MPEARETHPCVDTHPLLADMMVDMHINFKTYPCFFAVTTCKSGSKKCEIIGNLLDFIKFEKENSTTPTCSKIIAVLCIPGCTPCENAKTYLRKHPTFQFQCYVLEYRGNSMQWVELGIEPGKKTKKNWAIV